MKARFITVQEAASRLAISGKMIRKMLRVGIISGIDLGPRLTRVNEASVEELIARKAIR